MKNTFSKQQEIYFELEKNDFHVILGDSGEKTNLLKDKSIKLVYGSPPYPNAKRNYRTWESNKYIDEISPVIKNVIPKLADNGFIVINIKANRERPLNNNFSSERSLVVERLIIYMKDYFKLYCVDIEIWVKSNPVPTGLRVACQDAYEYNLWFSKAQKWEINIDSIRREYADSSLQTYSGSTYKPRKNGLNYVTKEKKIKPNPLGALPLNIVYGAVSGKSVPHQAVQPEYLSEKYILACTNEGDIVYDPWAGSGTTGVVALKNKRKFIGCEISDEFAKLAIETISKTKKGHEQLSLF